MPFLASLFVKPIAQVRKAVPRNHLLELEILLPWYADRIVVVEGGAAVNGDDFAVSGASLVPALAIAYPDGALQVRLYVFVVLTASVSDYYHRLNGLGL